MSSLHIVAIILYCAYALPSVRIHLEPGPTALLRVGASDEYAGVGRWLRFRIRHDVDGIYLLTLPSEFSRSWHQQTTAAATAPHDPDALALPRITELLYFGTIPLRVPMFIGAPTLPASRVGDALPYYDAVLGLGVHSVLWTHWERFTFCATLLTLGAFDMSVPRIAAHVGVASQFVPHWMYTNVLIDPLGFQIPLHASVSRDDAKRVHAVCVRQTSSRGHDPLVDELVRMRHDDPIIEALLRDDASYVHVACDLPLQYNIVLMPHSEYNILPVSLMRISAWHTDSSMMFHTIGNRALHATALCRELTDIHSACHADRRIQLPLIDACRDTYESGSVGGLPVISSRIADLGTLIVLGAPALRRLVWMHDLPTGISFVAAPYDFSPHMRFYDSPIAVVGVVLWAIWAIGAYPSFASRVLNASQARELLLGDVPHPTQAPETVFVRNNRLAITIHEQPMDGKRVFFGGTPQPIAAAAVATTTTTPTLLGEQQLNVFVNLLSHWLIATTLVEPTWSARASVMTTLRSFTDAIVMIHVLIALLYFDCVRFVTHTIDIDIDDTTTANSVGLARLAVGVLIMLIVACALFAQWISTSQPRISNLLSQLEILLGAWLVAVTLQARTASLIVMLLIGEMAFIVACMLATYVVFTSDRAYYAGTALLLLVVAAFCGALNWNLVISRMWNDHPCHALLSLFTCVVVTLPIMLMNVIYEHTYPLRVLIARFAACGLEAAPDITAPQSSETG